MPFKFFASNLAGFYRFFSAGDSHAARWVFGGTPFLLMFLKGAFLGVIFFLAAQNSGGKKVCFFWGVKQFGAHILWGRHLEDPGKYHISRLNNISTLKTIIITIQSKVQTEKIPMFPASVTFQKSCTPPKIPHEIQIT